MKIHYSLLALVSVIFTITSAQPPIPPKYPGHSIGQSNAPILFEMFFDHLCPDSKVAWPVIQQVVQKYPTQLYTIVHIFPLPYHRNSFFSTQAGLVVENATSTENWFDWLDLIFNNQEQYATPVTQNQTGEDVINMFAKDASSLGVSEQEFYAGMEYGNDFDETTRINWKYATTRGVYGTPIFFLNGVFVSDDSSMTLQQWSEIIDSLLPNVKKTKSKLNKSYL